MTATPLLLFLNPNSGGGLAFELLKKIENEEGVTIVRLPSDVGTWRETHESLIHDPNLRIVACGGDGTVNWVVSLMNEAFGRGDVEGRPPLAVIPFGTGNDMSRALGWGETMTEASVKRAPRKLRKIRAATTIRNFDVWTVEVKRNGTEESTTFQMLNYFSVGVDAEIASNFEKCRNGCCGCCFCCHCMSKACYCPVGAQSLCCKRSLNSYCKIDVVTTKHGREEVRQLSPKRGEKTIIFQAIPSMYAGRDPWGVDDAREVDDKLFEVTFQGGVLSLGCFQMGCNTGRPCCQASQGTVTVTEPCYYQIDGEGKMMNGAGTFSVSRSGSYPMIYHRI
jgi:diacylglycerol kinase (ATP)